MRFASLRYAVIGLVVLTAVLTVTAVAQGWRRPATYPAWSSPDGGDYQVCRDGIRFQVANELAEVPRPIDATTTLDFRVYSPPPIGPDPGRIVAEGTVTLRLQTVPYVADLDSWWYVGTHTQRWTGGQLLEPALDAIYFREQAGTELDDIEDCYLFPPTTRMVGKGSVDDHGVRAAYAYILPCDDTRDTDAHFEARTGGNILRLTSVESVVCRDDPAVPTPAAGFDTQRGTGAATLNGRAGYELKWKLVDGGPGGTNDFVRARLTGPGGAVVFRGSAAPPGKFPGSDQATGNNTAQLLP